eukprot:5737477-Lingulodinium_polyedra.AAC.1
MCIRDRPAAVRKWSQAGQTPLALEMAAATAKVGLAGLNCSGLSVSRMRLRQAACTTSGGAQPSLIAADQESTGPTDTGTARSA